MILGIGIDMVDLARFRELAEGEGSFLERVFTPQELADCGSEADRAPSLAARFAAKEAVLKALGYGDPRGSSWREIEVVKESSGKPTIRLHGGMAERAAQAGAVRIHVSLSHAGDWAMAQAVAEGEG